MCRIATAHRPTGTAARARIPCARRRRQVARCTRRQVAPVRNSISTVTQISFRDCAWAVRSSFAAAATSSALGSGRSSLGRSPPHIGTQAGQDRRGDPLFVCGGRSVSHACGQGATGAKTGAGTVSGISSLTHGPAKWSSWPGICARREAGTQANDPLGSSLVKDLQYRLDVNTLNREGSATQLVLNEIGRMRLRTAAPCSLTSTAATALAEASSRRRVRLE
jgi:hypothetical protein